MRPAMFCDHAFDYPAHELKRDVQGCVLCPRCAAACPGCGRVFHIEDVNADSLCEECESIDRVYGYENMEHRGHGGAEEHREKQRNNFSAIKSRKLYCFSSFSVPLRALCV